MNTRDKKNIGILIIILSIFFSLGLVTVFIFNQWFPENNSNDNPIDTKYIFISSNSAHIGVPMAIQIKNLNNSQSYFLMINQQIEFIFKPNESINSFVVYILTADKGDMTIHLQLFSFENLSGLYTKPFFLEEKFIALINTSV